MWPKRLTATVARGIEPGGENMRRSQSWNLPFHAEVKRSMRVLRPKMSQNLYGMTGSLFRCDLLVLMVCNMVEDQNIVMQSVERTAQRAKTSVSAMVCRKREVG